MARSSNTHVAPPSDNPLNLKHPALTPLPEALRQSRPTHRDEKPARADAAYVGSGRRTIKRESAYVASAKPFTRLEGQARKAAALATLQLALELIRAHGWCQGALVDATGRYSLAGAVMAAGGGRIEAEFAREVLRDSIWVTNLVEWNDCPARRRGDVVRELRRAIGVAGGHVARGGWRCSAGVAR